VKLPFVLKGIPRPVQWVGVGLVAFVAGVLLFDRLVLPSLVHQGQNVKVPDLAFMPLPQAEHAASAVGLLVRTTNEQFDATVPRGAILSQDPPAGILTRRGRAIGVVVSLGEEKATIPPLKGQDYRGAQLALGRLGLEMSGVARMYSDDVPANRILGTDPGPDSPIPEDRPVQMLMSLGPEPRRFLVPNWVGQRTKDVAMGLDAAGIRYNLSGRDAGLSGVVTWQNPSAGAMVTAEENVTLGVGHGR
jgi:beta-lactam-binding protein with PASTA domain